MKPGYRPEDIRPSDQPERETIAEKRPESTQGERSGETGVSGTVKAYSGRKAKQGSQGRLDHLEKMRNLLGD